MRAGRGRKAGHGRGFRLRIQGPGNLHPGVPPGARECAECGPPWSPVSVHGGCPQDRRIGVPNKIGIEEPPVLERVEPFFLAGWSIRVSEQTDAVGRLWARFAARAPSVPRLLSPPRFRQLASWTEESEDGIDIMVAVEVTDLSQLPIDLVGKSVPGCACLVFTHHGSMANVGESYRSIYQVWLARSDRRPTMPFNFERYFEDAPDPFSDSYSMQICVPVQ
jgi:predicted transcriptional regulator YdeE